MSLVLRQLTETNFADYETLTRSEGGGGCYCAYWHQKWTSHEAWMARCREAPERNRETVRQRVRDGFHVGVLAYRESSLVAWVSVGPLVDFHWTWPRVGALGDAARVTAGILCFAVAPTERGRGVQRELLEALVPYGRALGWHAIEGYPFDQSAIDKPGADVRWPGLTGAFQAAGFSCVGAHWLSRPQAERSIFRAELNAFDRGAANP